MATSAVFGGFVGAFLTGFVNGYYCFLIYAVLGFFVTLLALFLNPQIELEGEEAEEDTSPRQA